MADSTFVAELVDDISGPAKRAAGGVSRITDAFGKVQDVAVDAEGKIRNLKGQFVKLAPAGKKVSNIFTELAGKFKAFVAGQVAADLISSGIKRIGQAALDAARAVLTLALEFGKAVAQGAAFAEGLQFGLSKFLGSSAKAKGAIKEVMAISNALGLNFQEAGSQFQAFISAGFNQLQALNLLKFKADIIAVGDGGEASAEKIKEAFVQIEKAMAKGKIEADGFDSILSSLPVTKVQVLTILAKKMGKTFAEVAALDITQLPVDKLIESFQEAALKATGMAKTGELAAQKISTTFSGAAAALKNNLINQLTILGAKIGPQIKSTLLPILQRMLTFVGSPAFAKFGDLMAKGLASGAKLAAKAIDSLITGIESGIESVTKFTEGFTQGFEAAQQVMGPLQEAQDALFGGMGENVSVAAQLGRALGVIASVLMVLIGTFKLIVRTIPGLDLLLRTLDAIGQVRIGLGPMFSAAFGAITAFVTKAAGMAGAIISGWVATIRSGASRIVSAITETAKAAISAAEKVLKIGSPSKVFEQIGTFTAQGMAGGIEGGAPKVSAAAAGLIKPSLPSGQGGSTSNTKVSAPVSISVNAADDPEATAAAIKRMMVGELADLFEQINISVSAA